MKLQHLGFACVFATCSIASCSRPMNSPRIKWEVGTLVTVDLADASEKRGPCIELLTASLLASGFSKAEAPQGATERFAGREGKVLSDDWFRKEMFFVHLISLEHDIGLYFAATESEDKESSRSSIDEEYRRLRREVTKVLRAERYPVSDFDSP